jgi:antirestriction protein ArdC
MAKDVYLEITGRILDSLEKGCIPWEKPWSCTNGLSPKNHLTGRPYSGINVVLLAMSGFSSPLWLGYGQAKTMKGHVKAGSKGSKIFKWNVIQRTKEGFKVIQDRKTKRLKAVDRNNRLAYWAHESDIDPRKTLILPMERTVFNSTQIDGIDFPEMEAPTFNIIEKAEKTFKNMPSRPAISYGGNRAFYRPAHDDITLPPRDAFKDPESFYDTAYHELIHATGHDTRLSRKGITESKRFGTDPYAKEELIAELGASFVCGRVGIVDRTIKESSAYINGWIKTLRNDKRLLINAASAAEKASNYVMGEVRA